MEIKNFDSIRNGFKMVILKAYKNQPLLRYAKLRDDGIIMVKSERSLQNLESLEYDMDWIGWPENDVFLYNEKDYSELCKIYESGNREALNQACIGLELL